MEFAFKYGMWGLLNEEIPETQDLAAIYTGYTCLFQAKDTLELLTMCVQLISEFLVLKTCAWHRLNVNLPLNL